MIAARILAAAALAALLASPGQAKPSRAERAEARFADAIEGRVAGTPASCIRNAAQDGLDIIDGVGFAFRRGDTLWINRPAGAQFINDSDLPVIRVWGSSRLCRLDRVEMRDRSSLIPGPVIVLGDFVPYRLVNRGT